MPARILVLSASVGAGHVRAAQAVELALREMAPGATVRNVDVLTLTGPVFRRLYGTSYLDLVNHAPHLLGMIYDITDRAPARGRKRDRLRSLVQRVNLGRVIRLLKEEPWDAVVNTHFLPADIIATLRRRRKAAQRQITVVTDFDAHAFWVNQPCEEYCVATEEAALSLAHWGVPRETIRVTGIPIHPVFAKAKTREECLRRQGLIGDRPMVLLLAGGFGVGPIEKVLAALLAVPTPIEIAVVAGKNPKLRARLERAAASDRNRVRILGFTTEIDELMRAADVVVSKPGGLTTSEILACGAAMAIMNPIPGQESRNSDFLLENGAAVKINAASAAAHKIAGLVGDPSRLARLREAARGLGRARAAFEVAERALGLARG
jgi:processive 1,2-diacylglycerol beta-glucosyltransferase